MTRKPKACLERKSHQEHRLLSRVCGHGSVKSWSDDVGRLVAEDAQIDGGVPARLSRRKPLSDEFREVISACIFRQHQGA